MSTHFEDIIRLNTQRLADLKKVTADLEQELSEARLSLDHELAAPACGHDIPDWMGETCACAMPGMPAAANPLAAPPVADHGYAGPNGEVGVDETDLDATASERTAELLSGGRRSAYHRGFSPRARVITAAGAVSVLLVTILVAVLSGGQASWPASVATVQREISRACQNSDVKSEPGQVNFACAKATRQVLWVFALLTSADRPNFRDPVSGRIGLEPITPAQGGELAASLNLHHPYDPSNPIDSLQVAARAVNDIVGGATVTNANGASLVMPGLEGIAQNCARYTGSTAIISRQGFPGLCAEPVSSQAGQAALVADIYRKWMIGSAAGTAHDAGVLFENAANPGDPQVQSILRHIAG